MINAIQWLANHLFGAKVGEAYANEVEALIGSFLASTPGASEDAVISYVNSRSADTINKVLSVAKVPALLAPVVSAFLVKLEDSVVASLYEKVVASVVPVAA